MIWQQLDKDGELDKAELARALKAQVMSRKLSKLICLHTSEWGADYSSLEAEVTAYFDKIIDEADSNVKEDLETKKTAALEALKPKVENLDFWSKVKVASNKPDGIPSFGNDASSDAQTPSYMAWGEPQAEESTTIPFPTSPKVYHFHPIAFVEQMRMMDNSFDVIFPFDVKPQNDINNSTYNGIDWNGTSEWNPATFGARRSSGTRKHAGRDLYASWGMPIRAMADGVVIEVQYWSSLKVGVLSIAHTTSDGRSFICRYAEVDYKSITVKKGHKVKQGEHIARVGFLKYATNNNMPPKQGSKNLRTNMLHFEFYTNGKDHVNIGVNVNKSINIYTRKRSDLTDPLDILTEAYNNSFVKSEAEQPNRVDIQNLRISDAGIKFIKLFEGTHKSGLKHVKYDDSNNKEIAKATIGYGHLIANVRVKKVSYSNNNEVRNGITKTEFDHGISEVRATELLRLDLIRAENGVKKHISVPLSQNEFDALVSLSFNSGANFLGTGANGGDTQIKTRINKNDYYNGIDEIADVTNKLTAGLVKRRQCEITIFKSNYYATKKP